ncbi:lactadherin-like [Stylophora pistillata]|uniref:lactadherin-like n=1 Tax=Stylophora pistillata TaxID=50429 RepID=UPI000C041777|nr:lactadherin-like [Stylophora pistillata]
MPFLILLLLPCQVQAEEDCRDKLPVPECKYLATEEICQKYCGVCSTNAICNKISIKEYKLKASSKLDANHGPEQAILNNTRAWVSKHNNSDERLIFILGHKFYRITGIATQGRAGQWVKYYQLEYLIEAGDKSKVYQNKTFKGNSDQRTIVYHDLTNPSLVAAELHIRPVSWHGAIAMRMEIYGCLVCHGPLGMESGAIKDQQITASSYRNRRLKPNHGRLHFKAKKGSKGAWRADWKQEEPWLQVDLHSKNTWVTGIATQGREDANRWVTTYRLRYSDGIGFYFYKEKGKRQSKVFTGNRDRNTVVRHELEIPIGARIFRIYPLNFTRAVEMRMELYGCKDGCLYKPCKNGGTCVPDYINGNYTCICPDEFYGDTCRLGNLCELGKPCLNGGNCTEIRYWPYFKCTCPSNYTGFNCGFEIGDPCNQSYCLNNGTCQRRESWPYSQCKCSSGYAGFNCGTHIGDPCSNTSCPKGWTCKPVNWSIGLHCGCRFGKCIYPPVLECLSHPCLNGGTCLGDESRNVTCSCPPGFYGYNCEYKQDDACSDDPCLYNGTCIPDNNPLGFKCNCRSGYIGFNCGIHKGNPCLDEDNHEPCKNGGNCTQQDNALGYICKCTSKYIGFDCSFLKDDPCFPNPCQNDGNCTRDNGLKDFICNCSFGYTGKKMSEPDR